MKKILGFALLLAAILVLVGSLIGFPKLEVNLWPLFPVGLFLYFSLENSVKKDYKASLICGLIAFMIANGTYDFLPVSNGIVITAGVLACVGLGFLFPDSQIK